MSQIYSIPATWDQMDGDVQVGEVEAVIYFSVTPAGGDGWNEPRYDAQAEYHHVTYSWSGSSWPKETLDQMVDEWAAQWVEDNQDACLLVYQEAGEREREYAAELRAERRYD